METFLNYFNEYGIYLILLFIILEYSCFPVPSEIVLPAAGAYAAINNLNILLIIFLSIICGLIGSLICYLIGLGGQNIIIKKVIKKQSNELNYSINYYNKYKNFSVSFGRIVPLCRTYVSFIAGLNKHNIFSYLFYSCIGISIWNTILILLGYNFFYNLDVIALYYNNYKFIIIVIILIILIFIILKFLINKIRNGKINKGEKYENRKNKCNTITTTKEN